MAKIEMDVTEYDALRKNITLLEESKKETAQLNKQIDALKEEKLQVFRDMQMKVVKQTTVEHVTRTVGVRGTPEFNTLVKVIVEGICNRLHRSDYPFRSGSERRYNQEVRSMGGYDYDSPSHFHTDSMQAASPMEFVEYELSAFLNRLITTTSTKEGEPVYIGLNEVKDELYAILVSNQGDKVKNLLALEPAFNDFANKKAELESMTNTLLKEKLELDTALTSAKGSIERQLVESERTTKVVRILRDSLQSVTKMADRNYFFASFFKADLKKYLLTQNEKINKVLNDEK